jgi:hypothetical protein
MRRFCLCVGFEIWYEEGGHRVCRCGHPDTEHLDGERSCVGDVENG